MQGEERQGLTLAALSTAVAEATPVLFAAARRFAPTPQAAEDLVQETVLRAVERRGTFRGDSSPATWLHRILWNLAIDQARRGDRELLVADVEDRWRDDRFFTSPAVVAEQAADADRLRDALVRLPFIYRSAVVLHDSLGWTHPEIGERLGITVDTAKQRVHRGRMLLTTALAEAAERRHATKGASMRCWDARTQVGDYLDGALDAHAAAQLEAHLAGCPTCPPLYASLVGATDALGRWRDADTTVPPALAGRIAAALTTPPGEAAGAARIRRRPGS